MTPEAYLNLLANAIYSKSKALEVKNTLEYLGQSWYALKEQIKVTKLRSVPLVQSKVLSKDIFIAEQNRRAQDPSALGIDSKDNGYGSSPNGTKQRDIDVLVKLLPYYDSDLTLRNKENDDSKKLR